MRLNHTAACALHVLAQLARRTGGPPAKCAVIAAACGVPKPYLAQLLKKLAACGLLSSARGPGGGYRLTSPAACVTMLEVVEAVQGPVRGEVPDVGAAAGDGGRLRRRLQRACDEAAEAARQKLGKVTLADLAGG
jgi:Rrf2 family iron-sulfur cluster assembly transcriptional regulator